MTEEQATGIPKTYVRGEGVPKINWVDNSQGQIVELDPTDPFDKLVIPLIELNQRKRADYAGDHDIFANFKRNAAAMSLPGYTPVEDCLSMVLRKVGRLVNLRGRTAKNESVLDTVEDLIVYAILLKGLILEESEADGSTD